MNSNIDFEYAAWLCNVFDALIRRGVQVSTDPETLDFAHFLYEDDYNVYQAVNEFLP